MFRVICDFDGTITSTDVLVQMFEKFATPEWQALERYRRKGIISAQECLSQQVDLLHAQPQQLTQLFHRIVIDSVIPAFVDFCETQQLPLVIVSDGVDLAVRQILVHHGLGHLPIMANRLRQHTDNRGSLSCPHARTYCQARSGICQCQALVSAEKRTILIGDGISDTCIARQVSIVLAKGHLADYCVAERIPHLEISGFADALLILQQLLAHENRAVAYYH